MPKELAIQFLKLREIGEEKYLNFVNEQLTGEKSIWDTIKKVKLPTFVTNNKQVTIQVNKQLVNIKEERKLMTRFVIASRSRPDIDLPKYLVMYEFSVVPRALFTPDGFLHQTNDKSSIASEIRKLTEENHEILPPDEESGARKAMIFDGMAVVNVQHDTERTCF